MKSKIPRPIVNLARKVIMSILRNRWKTNPTVAVWIKKGYIDDARLFIGKRDYPTIAELTDHVKQLNSKYSVIVNDDMIRVITES